MAKKVLVIDDDVQLVETVKTLLQSVGFEVASAYQAEKGVELARQIKPDLILLDVMFAGPPGPDGIEVSRRLQQDSELKDIPVIILSGVRKVLDLPYKIGPDETWMPVKAFLEKPIKPDRLLQEIQKVLGSKG
ncbi:MAG TPA: response regulator [Candidatus Acidoferrum sp.]|nr:response regulator [Candidatus Acidoferrum sp.]